VCRRQHKVVGDQGTAASIVYPLIEVGAPAERRHEGEFPWSGGHPAHNRDQEDQVVLVGLLDIVQVVARCEFEGETLVSHGLHHAVQKTGVVIKTAVKC